MNMRLNIIALWQLALISRGRDCCALNV